MPKCLVSGGGGFIGSHLVDKLIKEKCEVVVVDNFITGKKENINKDYKIDIYVSDITDGDRLREIFYEEKPDYVFHLAALARIQLSIDEPLITFRTNVNGTLNMLECSKEFGVKRFIYSSSSSVYGNQENPLKEDMFPMPISPYAMQKYNGEQYCQIYSKYYDLETICLRYFNVYGTRVDLDSAYKLVMAIWAEQKKNAKPLSIYGRGDQTRDFTHVRDVVEANYLSMISETKFKADAFNIGSGEEIPIRELAKYFNWKMEFIKNPRPYEEKRKKADISKAKRILGWQPKVKISEGINELIKSI